MTSVLKYRNNKLNEEVAVALHNAQAYEGIVNGLTDQNTVLRLDIAKLSSSNDNLLQSIDSIRKELKIKPKDVTVAAISGQTLEVSEKDTVLVNDSCSFNKTFKPNNLTTLDIKLHKDSLQYRLKIENDQILIVSKKKVWKEDKFFKRLFTFKWGKITYSKYNIVNTNDLIKVGNTRVIENTESK